MKAIEDVEGALKMAMEENSKIKAIQETRAAKIMELKASLKESEARVTTAEKKIKDAKSSTDKWVKVTAMKAIANFWALKEFRKAKVQFTSKAYDIEKQVIWDRVAIQYPY